MIPACKQSKHTQLELARPSKGNWSLNSPSSLSDLFSPLSASSLWAPNVLRLLSLSQENKQNAFMIIFPPLPFWTPLIREWAELLAMWTVRRNLWYLLLYRFSSNKMGMTASAPWTVVKIIGNWGKRHHGAWTTVGTKIYRRIIIIFIIIL